MKVGWLRSRTAHARNRYQQPDRTSPKFKTFVYLHSYLLNLKEAIILELEMKSTNFWKATFIFLVFSTLISCMKENPKKSDVKKLPVKYLLSQKYKDIFNAITLNDTLVFIDTSNDTIVMKSDGKYENLFYSPNETRQGQELVCYYTCQSKYLSIFKIGYQLAADSNSNAYLNVVIISGNLKTSGLTQDFYASHVYLKMSDMNDSVFSYFHGYPYKFHDTISISSNLFHNCYEFNKLEWLGRGALADFLFFDRNIGIIKFNTSDKKVWILQRK